MKLMRINGKSLINKNYKYYRNKTISSAAFSAAEFAFAAMHASERKGFGTVFFGGASCLFLKISNNCYKLMKELKPEYKAIVNRAKSIYKK